jgi:hypothetical protein
MSGEIPLLLLYAFVALTGNILPFYCVQIWRENVDWVQDRGDWTAVVSGSDPSVSC